MCVRAFNLTVVSRVSDSNSLIFLFGFAQATARICSPHSGCTVQTHAEAGDEFHYAGIS